MHNYVVWVSGSCGFTPLPRLGVQGGKSWREKSLLVRAFLRTTNMLPPSSALFFSPRGFLGSFLLVCRLTSGIHIPNIPRLPDPPPPLKTSNYICSSLWRSFSRLFSPSSVLYRLDLIISFFKNSINLWYRKEMLQDRDFLVVWIFLFCFVLLMKVSEKLLESPCAIMVPLGSLHAHLQ